MRTLRATTSTGAVVDDPTPAEFASLIGEVGQAGDGAFLIIEHRAGPRGLTYLQAMADGGAFVVEIRTGPHRHVTAGAVDPVRLVTVVTSWAGRTADWETSLRWRRMTRPGWSPRPVRWARIRVATGA
jgi:hypothetical protein